jgi:DNA-binding response OmpR family regulator
MTSTGSRTRRSFDANESSAGGGPNEDGGGDFQQPRPPVAMPLDILLVEDDASFAQALLVHFSAQGWSSRWVATGEGALRECQVRLPDVVVLDLMLPDRSGLDVCVAIRGRRPTTGVLMLTARGAEADIVLGLDQGADDYVVKPCRPRELLARAKAVARRARSHEDDPAAIVRGALRIDPGKRRAWVDERELTLTPSEHELLFVLAARPGQVQTRVALLEAVFDTTHAGYVRNVDCHVARLRRKLEAAGLSPVPIRTLYGHGYCFEEA